MRTIHKQELKITDSQAILLPEGAIILCVKIHREKLCMWYECETENDVERVIIRCFGTGFNLDGNLEYIDTVITNNGSFVWHFFKERHPFKD